MKVLVFGATGKTGQLVVERALKEGHDVTVLVRDTGKIQNPKVRVLTGDATRPADVLNAVQGQDAVIESIGGTTPYKATRLETTSVTNIVNAMKSQKVKRLVVVSMMGLGQSIKQAPWWYKYLLMRTFLRGSTKDKSNKEAVVKNSGLDYILVRPPILKDGPATGSIKVLGLGVTGHAITRADLANFLVAQLKSDDHLRKAVTIVND